MANQWDQFDHLAFQNGDFQVHNVSSPEGIVGKIHHIGHQCDNMR